MSNFLIAQAASLAVLCYLAQGLRFLVLDGKGLQFKPKRIERIPQLIAQAGFVVFWPFLMSLVAIICIVIAWLEADRDLKKQQDFNDHINRTKEAGRGGA